MILYDDKYNFLGMSSDTLGFLGYEDIGEFLSQHNDFANLFVNKEGYIYKFDNFAWIDFVLYSGTANKKAIVTLKNGKEAEISVSIKELFLTKEIENSKKLYSVKVISDNFNEISGTPKDTSNIKKTIGGFSLGGLVKKEQKAEKEPIKKTNEFSSLIQESKIAEENSNNEGFILDIADNELISKNDIKPEIKEINNDSEDFKLNFLNDDLPSKEEPVVDLLKIDEVKEEPIVDLLKNDEVKEEPIVDLLKNDEVKEEPIVDLLKNNEVKEEPIVDLLKNDEVKEEPIVDLLKNNEVKEEPIVDLLKNDEVKKEPIVDLLKNNEVKKEPIVDLLKNDEVKEEPILDLLKSDEVKEEPILDLLKSDEVKEEPIVDLLKSDEVKEDFKFDFPKNISNNEPILDFLKNSDQKEEPSMQDKQEASKEPMIFSLLNDDKQESEKESSLEFNLPDENAPKKEIVEIKQEQNDDSNFSFKKAKEPLSFLINDQDTNETNLDLTPEVKEEKIENKEANLELDFLKVDEPKESIEKEIQPEDTNLEINFLTKPNQDQEEENENQKGLKNKKEIIKQIKKDIKEIDTQPKDEEFKLIMPKEEKQEKKEIDEIKSEDKSFTNTLNSLFNGDNEETKEVLTKQDEMMPNFLNEEAKNDLETFNPLSSLGLSADDEFELMSDFISDTNESIAVMEEFIKTNNIDKINYPLVKIKSSAEILNLDAIIDISNTIREETLDKNSKNVINHINTLREKVELLEKNLTKTVA